MTRFTATIAEQIWDMKYRFKDEHGEPIDLTVEDTWRRIAEALAEPELNAPLSPMHSPNELVIKHRKSFYSALEDWKFIPAGRIVAGSGTGRAVTLFNCFVMGTIPDSMDGIFSMLREAALTMQQGGGIGYDFSPIRPSTSRVKKLGADASGPLSFMDCWDAMCRTVMSAGSRRGAMMATMRCDHPDVEKFIEAKRDSAKLRMFNLSVLATGDFMEAVDENRDWPLVHIEEPIEGFGETPVILDNEGDDGRGNTGLPRYVHKVVKARDLWNQIMKATYDAAEPGVIFVDRINDANNLKLLEKIAATNPCGEQPLPPYGACLLGSINLAKMVLSAFTPDAELDEGTLRSTVRVAIRMMDNVIDTSNFPLEAQREEAMNKRRIGLGVTGLADALCMLRITYGTEEAAEKTEAILKIIAREAYMTSVELAKEKGPFPLFDISTYPAPGSHVAMLCEDDPELLQGIAEHGIRNALLTSIAPTGTISMYAGNVSSGVEPIFAYGYNRKVLLPDGTHMEERVEDYAVQAYREMWLDGYDQHGDPNVAEEWSDDLLPDYFVTAQTLEPEDHIRMQAAAQKWVDSAISKTVNLPEDISFEDFKAVYWSAYDQGCKGCTTYRPNEVTGSILSVDPEPEDEGEDEEDWMAPEGRLAQYGDDPIYAELDEAMGTTQTLDMPGVVDIEQAAQRLGVHAADLASIIRHESAGPTPLLFPGTELKATDELLERPESLDGTTYKIKVGDQKAIYLTVNDIDMPDGTARPFEIFLRSSDPTHDEWMVGIARSVSAVMRRGEARFLAEDYARIHSTETGGFQRGAGYQPSLLAAIGRKLIEHIDELKLMVQSPKINLDLGQPFEHTDLGKAAGLVADDPIPELAVQVKGKACPSCHSYEFKVEGGCPTCMSCGWSKCG